MHRLPTLFVLLIPLTLFAAKWSPYAGLGFVFNEAMPLMGYQNLNHSGADFPYSDFGSWWEVGMTSGQVSIYGAYRLFDPQSNIVISSWIPAGDTYRRSVEWFDWKDKRFYLGGRWTPGDSSRRWHLIPAVGAALSLGQSRYAYEFYYDTWGSSSSDRLGDVAASRTSKNTVGMLLEFGLLIRTGTSLDLAAIGQLHRYEAGFERTATVAGNHFVLIEPSLQITARYAFSSLSIGR